MEWLVFFVAFGVTFFVVKAIQDEWKKNHPKP